MTGTVSTDIGDTRLTVSLSGNLFQDRSNQFVSFFLSAGHNGRPFQCTFLATGNAGADKVKALCGQLFVTADGVLKEGVTAVDQNVAFIEMRGEGCDGFIGGFTGFDHQQDTAGFFQGVNKLFNAVAGNQFFPRVFSNHFVSFIRRAVKNRNRITAAFDIQCEVTAHNGHTDNTNLLFGHEDSFRN